jgi:hypothetical protein
MIIVNTIRAYVEECCSLEDGKYLNMSSDCNVLLATLYSVILGIGVDPFRREEFEKVVKSYIRNLNIDILDVVEEYRKKPTDPSVN